jgi:hypothetical protein
MRVDTVYVPGEVDRGVFQLPSNNSLKLSPNRARTLNGQFGTLQL